MEASRHPPPRPPERGVRITIDLRDDAGPIAGTLRTGSGAPRTFVGWLELAAALEAVRSTPPPGEGAPP